MRNKKTPHSKHIQKLSKLDNVLLNKVLQQLKSLKKNPIFWKMKLRLKQLYLWNEKYGNLTQILYSRCNFIS